MKKKAITKENKDLVGQDVFKVTAEIILERDEGRRVPSSRTVSRQVADQLKSVRVSGRTFGYRATVLGTAVFRPNQ